MTLVRSPLRAFPVVIALIFNMVLGPLSPAIGGLSSVVRADDVVITQDDDINGCNGVVSTPGSENTNKRLVSGSLEPGGTATFEISYPVDPVDVSGRTEFEITDCVFIEEVAVAKYFIHFVPNTENFILTFTLNIPDNAPVGDEYCNYAKTTAAPSQSQASNRKAGPACFLIGGDLLIHKTDAAGAPLAGATFSVACTWPTSQAALAGTVITAQPDGSVADGNDANGSNDASESYTSVSGGSLTKSATTGSDGTIAVAAPVGTSCTFTETAPPAGYLADPTDLSETLVVTSGEQQTHTFVNTVPPASLKVVKTLDGEVPASDWAYTGSFAFSLPAAGGDTTMADLAPGSYTVTETTKPGYDVSVSCDSGETGGAGVTVDLSAGEDVVCTFDNVAQPGSITVIKALQGEVPGATWGYTGDLGAFSLPAAGGQTTFDDLDAGSYDIAEITKPGYDVSVSCTSGETGDDDVTVDLDPGEHVTCTFTNIAQPASLTVIKTLDGEVPGADWAYSGTGSIGDFTLPAAGGQTLFGSLASGPYTIGETTKPGYDVTVSCDSGETGSESVAIDLDPGEEVVCTFANVARPASLTVVKQVVGDAPGSAWDFDVHGEVGVLAFPLPAGGGQTTMASLPSGTYAIHETTKTGYRATASCDSGETGDASLSVDLDPGESVICTFVNTEIGIDIDKSNDAEVSGEPGTVVRGDVVHFTIEVNVTGADANDVVVTDTLPAGLAYVADSAAPSGGFSAAGQALEWTVGTLAVGQHFFSYDALVTDDAAGTLTNLGCIASSDLDDELCDDSSVNVTPPSVDIDKVNNAEGSVTRGSTVHYTLTVTVANGPAHDVLVTDDLPDGIDYKADTADPDAGFSLSLDGRSLSWDAGTLGSGTHTFEYDGLVASDAPINAELTNVGCVAASDDATENEICDNSTITVTPPTISIDKSNEFEGESVVRGQAIDYAITVDVMDGPMQNAVVSDTLPAGLTYVDGSAIPAPASVVGQVITWELAELATGEHAFSYTATVDDTASGDLTNLACVDTDEIDAALCDQTTVDVTPPAVDIDKVNNAEGPVARGSMVEYTLTVTVTNGPIAPLEVSDTLPDGLTYVVGSADPMDGFAAAGQELTWTLASRDSGTYEFSYTALVDGDAEIGTQLVNTGCVSSPDDAEDGLICDESEIEVIPAEITFAKSSSFEGESVLRGTTIDYSLTVTVTNGPVHNALITDVLPDGLTYADGSADPAEGLVVAGQELTWTIGELANGTHEFTYAATVDADADGELANLACIDVDETDAELCDQTTIEVRVPTLVIDKAADTDEVELLFDAQGNLKSVDPEVVTWTLTWSLAEGPVTNAVISDELPEFLTYVDGSASDGGSYDPATRTLSWAFPTLSAAAGSVTFQTTVDANAPEAEPIENVALIDSDETAPDDGRDSITVTSQSEQGVVSTPKPSVPNTATATAPGGQPITIPVELLALLFLGSLGSLVTVNVRMVRRRR